MVKTAEELVRQVAVTIPAPNMATVELVIQGTAPLVVHRFANKSVLQEKMAEGKTAAKSKKTARDFEKDGQAAKYVSTEGWEGFNASGVRQAMISACRLVNFKMTLAKLSVFIEADGLHEEDGVPLIRIYGDSKVFTAYARNATGVVDIRARPMYKDWAARIRVTFDADQFRAQDVVNLLSRVGLQVGLGEGRPDSKQSAGCGWGVFRVVPGDQEGAIRKKYGIK